MADLAHALRRLTDPAAAAETLHWGRNYLYRVDLPTATGTVPVVVKQFRGETSARARWSRRRRGTKAERSWRAAHALVAAHIATPAPIAWIESTDPAGPSWYVCRLLEGALEVRYLLRAANAGTAAEVYPDLPLGAVVDALAVLARRLHEAGVWFRDFTSGNVLLRHGAGGALDLALVDLNRARFGRRPTLSERTRDLCRMPLQVPALQRRMLETYWAGCSRIGWHLRWSLYRLYHQSFLTRNRVKASLRGARGKVAGKVVARSAHAHIPTAPEGAGVRDKIVWDHLSDQPHIHAGPLAKLWVRLSHGGAYAAELAAAIGAAPRIRRRYRELSARLYRDPVLFAGAGLAVRPWPQGTEALLARVDELGVRHVLLRVHPWEPEGRDAEEELARALVARGIELSFVVPQNRELVKAPRAWVAALEDIAARFTPLGRAFQVGQAINRSKWGVWAVDEYVELVQSAEAILRRHRPDILLLGPAVIDFEFLRTAGILNLRREGFRFDALASLLYVDRRGAPENPQMGLDTVGKVVLQQAIAETARNVAPARSWITEVNWPLWEGPHSPAGRSVSVDEEAQANYLVRYYLAALGTGLVERVFWWQLIARGYGLAVADQDGTLRCRPAFHAFRTLLQQTQGATFCGPLPAPDGARLYHFQRGDRQIVVGWGTGAQQVEIDLPWLPEAATSRDGDPVAVPRSLRVRVGPAPVYFGH